MTGHRRWCRMLAAAAVWGLLPTACLRADTAYTEDFSAGVAAAEWSGSNLAVSQASGTNTSWYLGPLNNDVVSLPLTGLDFGGGAATPNSQGQHSFVTVSYDLFIIGDWTGNNSKRPDSAHTFAFYTTDSTDIEGDWLTTTFSNQADLLQTFPYDSVNNGYFSQSGGKGATEINSLGFSGAVTGYDDAVYRMAGGRNQSFTFNHGVDDLTLNFLAGNLDSGATWGITNLKVTTGGIFGWQAAPSIGDGLDGGWDVGQHWANPDPSMSACPGPDDAAEFTADGTYNVSIHQDTSVGFISVKASNSSNPGVQFNTIGHALTLSAGNANNASVAVADGFGQASSLFIFNSNNDPDSTFTSVINAETLRINTAGTLTLDGYLDPAQPGTDGTALGNVVLNLQREMNINGGGLSNVATLNILHGAILNGGLGGGSASSNPADDNASGVYAYTEGTVNVDDQSIWNQTGSIWAGVMGHGEIHVTGGSQINIFQLAYAGQKPAIGGSLAIGGFPGSDGMVRVNDPDSQINAGQVQIGTTGADGSLTIDNSGVVNATSVSVGSYIGGFSGPSGSSLVNATHRGQLNVTTPAADGQLSVGDYFDGRMTLGYVGGSNGNLFNTGQATADIAVIGNAAGVTGEVDVSYAQAGDLHSLFTVNTTLTVGAAGQGTLFMNTGGVCAVLGQGSALGTMVTVGDQAGSNGLVYLGGGAGGADWAQGSTFDASAGGVVLGNSGIGRLYLVIGGQAFAKSVVMAQAAGSSAEVSVDGDGSDHIHTTLLRISDTTSGLAVGHAGTSASATVTNGGMLETYRASVGGQGDNLGSGSVRVEDLRDPATVTNHETGSLWLVHGQSLGVTSVGGTLDIGGEGMGGQHGGSGAVTVGSGGMLGVAVALQLGSNGRLDVSGGSATVGSTDPLVMDPTPNRLHIVANTPLPAVNSSVSGMGVIAADVLVHSGGTLGPNGSTSSQTGPLSIIGSLHELSGGNLSTHIRAAAAGSYDTFALRNAALSAPAGTATLSNGAGVSLIGEGFYHTPQVGDYIDVVTAANVICGTLNLTFINLPAADWHYGVVSIPGGQALRVQYGAAVHEPGSVSISGTIRLNGAPEAGVLVAAVPGFSALTDGSGHFLLSVPSGASGTLTPNGIGFQFSPPLRAFATLTADLTGQDFAMSGSIEPTLVLSQTGPLQHVTWTGIDGVSYQAQASIDLVDWAPSGSPMMGTNGPLSFTFETGPAPKRFFRVRAEK